MSDLTIKHAGSTVTQTRQEVLSNNKKLNQMKVDLIDVVPTCDTDAIPNDDVIFDWVEIPNAVAVKGGSAIIQSIHLLDKAIKSATMDIFFQTDNTTLGTLGGDPSLGDADATDMLGFTTLSNYSAIGTGNSVCTKTNLGIVVKAAANTRSIYMAAINRSGSSIDSYSATSLNFRIGIVQD